MSMTTIEVILLFIFIIIAGGLLLLAWRLLSCLQSISLSMFRFQDRDRRDMIHLFERMEEKRAFPGNTVLSLHSQERIQETASSARMEEEALRNDGEQEKDPPLVRVTPDEELNSYGELFSG